MKNSRPIAAIVLLASVCWQLVVADERCAGVTCDKCLQEKGCVWMHGGKCAEDCETFPDINCYFPRMTGSPLTNRFEICEIERELHSDNRRCFTHTDQNSCRDEIGCVWLNGVMPSGKQTFWCSLLLESAVMFQHKHHTYPPHTTAPLEEGEDDDMHAFHPDATSVVEYLLGFYTLLPFCFWGCWWLRALIRKASGYDDHSVV